MRILLAGGAMMLAAAACAPAAQEAPAAPAPAEGVTVAPPAMMAPEAIVLPEAMVGRWGITAEACGPANAAKDGVIEITATTVAMGLDTCTTTSSKPEGAGVVLVAQCKSGEGGEDYERNFSFVSASPDTLTWTTEGGQNEAYVRCP